MTHTSERTQLRLNCRLRGHLQVLRRETIRETDESQRQERCQFLALQQNSGTGSVQQGHRPAGWRQETAPSPHLFVPGILRNLALNFRVGVCNTPTVQAQQDTERESFPIHHGDSWNVQTGTIGKTIVASTHRRELCCQ